MATVYIGMGGNLGDREGLLNLAAQQLTDAVGPIELSSFFETDPVGFTDQPRFLNAVARATTELCPHGVLDALQQIELDLGRERSFPNAPRTIDLDLLCYDDLVFDSPDLTLPHPRFHERFFVLVPLADLAPDLVHPRLHRPVRELLDDLGPATGIWKYESA